jgi:hypothetical protein
MNFQKERFEFCAAIIDAYAHHLDAPREVNVLLSDRTMQTWDSMFLENLARDGILLYARGSLPAPLAHDSLCNGLLKTKEPDVENYTKLWQDI